MKNKDLQLIPARAMKIWVDADACPVLIKDILFRAADRLCVETILVANKPLHTPPSRFIKMLQVGAGFDVADNEIVARLQAGDLVITSDIPLASEVVDKGGLALSPRGELYSSENIKALLNMRDFMDTMRASGMSTGGPPPFGPNDCKAFAKQFDKLLSQ